MECGENIGPIQSGKEITSAIRRIMPVIFAERASSIGAMVGKVEDM